MPNGASHGASEERRAEHIVDRRDGTGRFAPGPCEGNKFQACVIVIRGRGYVR